MLKEKIRNVLDLIQEANDIFDSEADWQTKHGLIYTINIKSSLQEIGLSCRFTKRRFLVDEYEMDIKDHIFSVRKVEENLKKVINFERYIHDPSKGCGN